MQTIQLKAPYLIFVEDETSDHFAKTGAGIVEWRRSKKSNYRYPTIASTFSNNIYRYH